MLILAKSEPIFGKMCEQENLKAASPLRCLSKRGLQYGCGKLVWKEYCQTYVLPANGPKIKSRRADSNR
jgi:hypothetical protein